jgi:hypothetical protein
LGQSEILELQFIESRKIVNAAKGLSNFSGLGLFARGSPAFCFFYFGLVKANLIAQSLE